MTLSKRLISGAALAGLCAIAAPAAAQPADPYYPTPGEQIVQGVIDGLLGSRHHDPRDRGAVRRCANAAVDEAWRQFGPRWRDQRGRGRRDRPQMHVTAITDVERRSAGLRVRGEIDSGLLYARGGGYRSQVGDLRFRCNIDNRGRITIMRVDRNPDFRPPRPF